MINKLFKSIFIYLNKYNKMAQSLLSLYQSSYEEDIINQDDCCPNKKIIFDEDNGINVCVFCGIQFDINITDDNDWINDSCAPRCKKEFNYFTPNKSLYQPLFSKNKNLMKRNLWLNGAPYEERMKEETFEIMANICRSLGVSQMVMDMANILFHNISNSYNDDKRIIYRGDNRKGIIGSCIFQAGLQEDKPIDEVQLANAIDIKTKYMKHGLDQLRFLLENNNYNLELKNPDAVVYIQYFCEKKNIPQEYINLTTKIIRNLKKLNISCNHTELSIGFSCLKIVSDLEELNITNEDIAEYYTISDLTLDKTIEEINEHIDVLISDERTNHVKQEREQKRKINTLPPHLQRRLNRTRNK